MSLTVQQARMLALRSIPCRRPLSSAARLLATPPFSSGPAPPRLPKEDQALFEELQRSSTGAFSAPKPAVVINQSPASSASPAQERTRPQINQSPHHDTSSDSFKEQELENIDAKVQARGEGEELHPNVRRGSRPEFEGDRNPETGETGGPKNNPLRWGGNVDWSYNGRVTDF